MKTVLLLTVLLSGILTASAAAVEAVEPAEAPVEVQEKKPVVAVEPAVAPVEVQEEKPVAENEVEVKSPKEEVPEGLTTVEAASSDQGHLCRPGLVREENSCNLYLGSKKPLSSAEEGAFIESVKKNLPADTSVEPANGRRRRRRFCLCICWGW